MAIKRFSIQTIGGTRTVLRGANTGKSLAVTKVYIWQELPNNPYSLIDVKEYCITSNFIKDIQALLDSGFIPSPPYKP